MTEKQETHFRPIEIWHPMIPLATYRAVGVRFPFVATHRAESLRHGGCQMLSNLSPVAF